MMFRSLTLAVMIATPAVAIAQTDASVNVIGSVTQSGPSSISIVTDGKSAETFALPQNVLIIRAKKVAPSDIKPNDYVASAASRGADGRLHSIEVRIFPEALRGVGEGQRRLDQSGGLTMTNATVTGTAFADGSNRLTVNFTGGQSELVVDRDVPVIRMDTADLGEIRPGTKVRVQGTRSGAEGPTAARITIAE